MRNRPQYAVGSVDHALRLAVMLQLEGPLRGAQAADRLGVARSTAHRLLSMLVYRDFAVQDPDKRYSVGPVLAHGARSDSPVTMLRSVALPHMLDLVGTVRESANLQVLSGDKVRFIATIECDQALRVGDREGKVLPANLASGGRTMLAELSEEQIRELYDPQRWVGDSDARPDVGVLLRELRTVRKRGFAINQQKTEPVSCRAIGRVVRATDGSVLGAISVAMPTIRFVKDQLPAIVIALTLCSHEIERDMASVSDG